ncbi:hypothetical protein BH23BAC4_BH23BAC4_07300 [soil metagenome]
MEMRPQEDEIERVLEWYEKDPGEALVGDEPIRDLGIDELKELFNPDEDDPDMLLTYEVEPTDVSALQQAVDHEIDLAKYDYFVAAYSKEE